MYLVDCLFTLNLHPLSELMKSVGSRCSLSQAAALFGSGISDVVLEKAFGLNEKEVEGDSLTLCE
jgi:hypothetical protein